jgi:hypothetical protein
MLDFTDEQKLAQRAIRAWCTEKLEPRVPALEAGTLEIALVLRELGHTFGLPDMARASFEKMVEGGQKSARRESEMSSVLMMELSRVCPGFAMSLGATMGLFGGAVMSAARPSRRGSGHSRHSPRRKSGHGR